MNHIFYLHSNTCVMSSYDMIEKLVKQGESVIVISERKVTFPFFEGKVKKFDMQEVIDKNRRNTSNIVLLLINYKTRLHPQCRIFAEKVINREDFILYTPSYNMYTIKPFVNSRFCLGYYYIEEGFQAYLSQKTLRKNYLDRRYRKGRILMDFVGAGESLDYKVTPKFRGCICLSDFSFPWCNEKIIAGFDSYFSQVPYEDVEIDNLITTDLLKNEIGVIEESFKVVIDQMLADNPTMRLGIKFHPSAFAYAKGKVARLTEYVRKTYPSLCVIFLPAPYSIELLMYHRKLNVYCVFGISSLMLYGLMLKTRPFMVNRTGEITEIRAIQSIPEFLDLSNSL